MGHADGSVQARYSQITTAMRQRLMHDLNEQWKTALRSQDYVARLTGPDA
jgi:hypothetical protein